MDNSASILTVLKRYLGTDSIQRAVQRTSLGDLGGIGMSRFADIFGEWVENFSLPPLPQGDTRPLMLANYGWHEVHVEHVDDVVDVFRGHNTESMTIAELFGNIPSYWLKSNKPETHAIVDRIKLHCLYANSVALEFPWPASTITFDISRLFEFIQICSIFEPLLANGILHITPSLEDLKLPVDRSSLRPPEVGEPQASWPAFSLPPLLCENS